MSDSNNWDLNRYERNVFSQFGEDGIIEKILSMIPSRDGWCVEFGAWDGIYLSNTRNLILDSEYKAVLIEANKSSFNELLKNYSANKRVICLCDFVGFAKKDGLDAILGKTECPKNFDFLSIDIDGNDYHVWRAINEYRPKLVCVEYNPQIPNEVEFVQAADPSVKLGASVAALTKLGKEKGYELICINPCNCFFVEQRYFDLFGIPDNSIQTLRKNSPKPIYVFPGYSGEVVLTGNVSLPWHGLVFGPDDFQVLPKYLRSYALEYSPLQRTLFKMFLLKRRFANISRRVASKIANIFWRH